MGLVGLGHVGREVARRATALGFTLLGYDPQPPAAAVPGVDLVPLDTLLARSDIVSVHARLTPENRKMFSRDRFAQMRPGAYFINTARESLVDELALRQALEQGLLGGAALDVLEQTPAGGRHPLLSLPNVFITPHIGGATAETLARGARRAVAAVTELLAGRVPANVVNPQVQVRPAGSRL
jgi:D-3-phosphoglycerate dehydrogenase